MKGRRHNENRYLQRAAKHVVAALIFAGVSGGVIVYAWFSNVYYVSDNLFTPGTLTPDIEIQYWDKTSAQADKWTPVEAEGDRSEWAFPNFGYMTDIAALPSDCDTYLRLKVNDSSGAKYQYSITVDRIDVAVDIRNIDAIDYYDDSPPKSCIEYELVRSGAADQNPTEAGFFTGAVIPLDTPGQSLTPDVFAASDEWLYIKLKPRLAEIQNIVRCLPIDYEMYEIALILYFSGESRTINDETV